jgi:hypothetical protein
MLRKMTLNAPLLAFLVLFSSQSDSVQAQSNSSNTSNSTAVNQNPYEEGCLKALLPEWNKTRVCNSEDDPYSSSCRSAPLPSLLEIRLYSLNWESAYLQAWLLQIILSELVDVPATIESGMIDAHMNFYDPQARIDLGDAEMLHAMEEAYSLKSDCTLRGNKSCTQYIPEVWDANLLTQGWKKDWVFLNKLQPPVGDGLLGQEALFIPKFTGQRDPSLLSYLGLQGEQNRRKVAETFLRPTTWKDYCDQVSLSNCTIDDGTAKRSPLTEEEELFFADGLYTGHFRKTDKNDCDKWPLNCTGHAVDYPCGWTSFTGPQIYHLDMAFEFDGPKPLMPHYTVVQMVELWYAANATKSNLFMMWWSPEMTYQMFQGTDAEFTRVGLPPPTQECIDNRRPPGDRCSEDFATRVGDPRGACDEAPLPLTKFILGDLHNQIYDPDIPEAIRSPALQVLDKFSLSNVQLGSIFQYWRNASTPREAVCKWATDNIEFMQTFIPVSYPRVLKADHQIGLTYASTLLAALTVVLVLVTGCMVYRERHSRVMQFAQLNFLYMLLSGSLLIASGATLTGFSQSNFTCVVEIWLINIGYALELIPLIIKVAAINRLIHAAQRMRRVRLEPSRLIGGVALILFFVIVFLSTWTVIDPPTKKEEYFLGEVPSSGETEVIVTYFCSSSSPAWNFSALAWNAVLLLIATVLAIQARSMPQSFNESQTLPNLIYSHFVFVLLRVVTFLLPNVVKESTLGHLRSFLFSIDTILTLAIYFWPKFTAKDEEQRRSSSLYQRQSIMTAINAPLQWISNITMIADLEDPEEESERAVDEGADTRVGPVVSKEYAMSSTEFAKIPESREFSKSTSSVHGVEAPEVTIPHRSLERRRSHGTNTTEESMETNSKLRSLVEQQKATISMLEKEVALLMERMMVNQADQGDDDISTSQSQI